MTERFGWQMAETYASPESEVTAALERAALADVSWLTKLDLKGAVLAGPVGGMGGSFALAGTEVPGGTRVASVWTLARGHALVTCEPKDRDGMETALAERIYSSVTGCCHLTDVTAVYAALLLTGPRSRDVLNRLTDLDVSDTALPAGACAQTGLAHTHAIVLRTGGTGVSPVRPDERQGTGNMPVPHLAFLLLVGWEYGEYVWDALLEAGECVGVQPIGLQTVDFLRQETVT